MFKLTNNENNLKELANLISMSLQIGYLNKNDDINDLNNVDSTLEKYSDAIIYLVKSYFGYMNKKLLFFCNELLWNLYHISIIENNLIDNTFNNLNQKSKEIIKLIDLFDAKNKKVYSVNNVNNKQMIISHYDKLFKQRLNNETNEVLINFDSQTQHLVTSISNIVIFKFFCLTCILKLKYSEISINNNEVSISNYPNLASITINNNSTTANNEVISNSIISDKLNQIKKIRSIEETFRPFDNLLYELGNKYLNLEIAFIKHNLLNIFFQDSKKTLDLDNMLYKGYFELINDTLSCVDDFFYTLKVSGTRAVESYNLQYCLTIFNIIKDVIQSDLLEILDSKFGLILKRKFGGSSFGSNKNGSIEYYPSSNDPCLSSKFNKSNLYVIICLNTIVQCQDNTIILLEESKKTILKTYFNNSILEATCSNARNNNAHNVNTNNNSENNDNCVFNSNNILPQLDKYISISNKHKLIEEINENAFKQSDKNLVQYTFQDLDSISKVYDSFLNEKIKSLIEDNLLNYIKTSVDLLNQVNYNIDSKNSLTAELSESFSLKFIEETDILLKQWKAQMNETCFNKFLKMYCFYIVVMIENSLLLKRFSSYGAIILEKDLNKIINFFNQKATISIRDKFSRLLKIVNILNLENQSDIEEFINTSNSGECRLTKQDIDKIWRLKVGV